MTPLAKIYQDVDQVYRRIVGSHVSVLLTTAAGPKRPVADPGNGGPCPHVGDLKIFFASILILLLSRLHTMDRGNTKVAVCRRFLLSNRLVFAAFCCLCAVHCMQAAAASFVSPKGVFLACKIGG